MRLSPDSGDIPRLIVVHSSEPETAPIQICWAWQFNIEGLPNGENGSCALFLCLFKLYKEGLKGLGGVLKVFLLVYHLSSIKSCLPCLWWSPFHDPEKQIGKVHWGGREGCTTRKWEFKMGQHWLRMERGQGRDDSSHPPQRPPRWDSWGASNCSLLVETVGEGSAVLACADLAWDGSPAKMQKSRFVQREVFYVGPCVSLSELSLWTVTLY